MDRPTLERPTRYGTRWCALKGSGDGGRTAPAEDKVHRTDTKIMAQQQPRCCRTTRQVQRPFKLRRTLRERKKRESELTTESSLSNTSKSEEAVQVEEAPRNRAVSLSLHYSYNEVVEEPGVYPMTLCSIKSFYVAYYILTKGERRL